MTLVAELNRRKVFKAGAAYLVVAWLMVQAASIGFPAFEAPPWALRVFILVAMLGFPLALVLAWVLDLTPEGIRLDAKPSGSGRLYAIAALLAALALAWYFRGQPAYRADEGPSQAPATPATGAPAADARSLAVLPFANMSPDPENEFFADGISEELLNVLSRVGQLKVASRTSAFAFKGKDKSVREIARELGVAHVVEGSVRKQGQRVRITAQLIDARTDQHLWSDTYDRELTDIFAVQEEIARAISGALGKALGLEGGVGQVRVAKVTGDLAAYEVYLRGRQLFHQRGESLATARQLLEDAVARDPQFAQAWAVLSAVHIVSPGYITVTEREGAGRADHAARRALELDDSLALPYAVLGRAAISQGDLLQADQWLEQAIEHDARESSAWLWRGGLHIAVGEFVQAEEYLRKALEIDPYTGINHGWFGLVRSLQGDREQGDAEVRRASELGWSGGWLLQVLFALDAGDRAGAANAARNYYSQRRDPPPGVQRYAHAAVEAILDPARGSAFVDAVRTNRDWGGIGPVSMVAALGMHREAVELAIDPDVPPDASADVMRWVPSARGTIEEPGFIALAEQSGLMAWWRARGFPDGCRLADAPARHLDCTERWQ
jgi:TolB-like protein/Tfp pilus assembly protein PilF